LDIEYVEQDLVLLGLIGLLDPPRPEAEGAVELCKSAGVIPIMITGDHPSTARAIAVSLGICGPDDPVLTGEQLARLADTELAQRIWDTRVYARVDPAQKIRIVSAARASGQFVAMTGDGVNDAPALAYADIGVAMGKAGTDVAREASSLILLDDNFATIVAAVAEGRRIFDNVRKFVSYVLTCNVAEILTILLAPVFGLPLPLLPIHILWINLVTDGLPGLALAAEPAEAKVMQRPPRPSDEGIFAHGLLRHILWVGLVMSGVTLGTQAYAIRVLGSADWQTMVFMVLTLSQMGNALATRSERESLFAQGVFSNLYLIGAALLTVTLQLVLIYVPFCNDIFKTAPLSAAELATCFLISSVVFVVVEAEKWLARRGLLYRGWPETAPQSAG
jgi:Ca2+-transporting ATPase